MELLHSLQKNTACYGSEVFAFNLPVPGTCKPTRWCTINCYAKSIRLDKSHRQARYKISLSKQFPDLIIKEIKKKKIKFVRLHATGDFYSNDYIKKWIRIAENSPATFFRTSTRRRDLTPGMIKLNALKNFVVRESLDPSRTRPVMNLPLVAVEGTRSAKNFFRCPLNCNKCNYYCWRHKVNVLLPVFYHTKDGNFLIPDL
jgi:hypothetical protein